MISSIRNPWLRRSIILAGAVPWSIIMLAIDALISLEQTRRDVCAAWRGPARGR